MSKIDLNYLTIPDCLRNKDNLICELREQLAEKDAEIERLRGAGLDLIQKVNFMGLSVTLDDDVIDAIEDFEQALQGKSE